METLDKTYRVVTSKTAQRTLVNAALLTGASVTLLCLAAIASSLFYRHYLPDQVAATPVHLQYGSGLNPFGIATLGGLRLKSQQEYDITVTLSMPRSPANTDRGNFMIALHLLDSGSVTSSNSEPHIPPEPYSHFDGRSVLFSSRRPAILPYRDPIVSVAERVFLLLYHIVFPESQTCTLTIPMAERVEFTKNTALPASAYLEVQAGQEIQTYHVWITMIAQLRGLRWLMYHYRILTFLAATLLFWAFELLFMAVAWVALVGFLGSTPPARGGKEITGSKHAVEAKQELAEGPGDFSDAPRTFPTYGNQPALKYEPEVKEEIGVGHQYDEAAPPGGEADDEDEDEGRGGWKGDSGIGTSYDEGAAGSSLRRRSSHSR